MQRILVNDGEEKKEKGTFGEDVYVKIIYSLKRMAYAFKFLFRFCVKYLKHT